MPIKQPNLRRAQLFELLRQKNAADSASARVRAREVVQAHIGREDQVMIQARAVQSWGNGADGPDGPVQKPLFSLGNRWLPQISQSYRRAKPAV